MYNTFIPDAFEQPKSQGVLSHSEINLGERPKSNSVEYPVCFLEENSAKNLDMNSLENPHQLSCMFLKIKRLEIDLNFTKDYIVKNEINSMIKNNSDDELRKFRMFEKKIEESRRDIQNFIEKECIPIYRKLLKKEILLLEKDFIDKNKNVRKELILLGEQAFHISSSVYIQKYFKSQIDDILSYLPPITLVIPFARKHISENIVFCEYFNHRV
jgi:hypothetical protein